MRVDGIGGGACVVREGSGQPWEQQLSGWAEETLAPSPTHQHGIHSWEVLAPAHLLTRQLLPHKTRQSQDLWDKYSLMSHPELPRFGWSLFLTGSGADLMGCRLGYSPGTPYPEGQPPSAVQSTRTWQSLGRRGWAHTCPGPHLCHCPAPKTGLSAWHGVDLLPSRRFPKTSLNTLPWRP